jgi:hypothetical protein
MDYLKEINGIFNRFIVEPRFTWNVEIPEGYRLVETDEHKKQRIEAEIQQKKKMLSYHEKALASLSAQIEQEEKELLSLTQ